MISERGRNWAELVKWKCSVKDRSININWCHGSWYICTLWYYHRFHNFYCCQIHQQCSKFILILHLIQIYHRRSNKVTQVSLLSHDGNIRIMLVVKYRITNVNTIWIIIVSLYYDYLTEVNLGNPLSLGLDLRNKWSADSVKREGLRCHKFHIGADLCYLKPSGFVLLQGKFMV